MKPLQAYCALMSCSLAVAAAGNLTAGTKEVLAPDETVTVETKYDDRLTGDWGGARTQLAESGVEVFAYYNSIVAGNVSGGIEQDTNIAGDTFFGAIFDLEKLLGWADTTFTVSGINRWGSDITPSIGAQYSAMQLVGGQTTFLYNVTLEKLFADGDWSIKVGRMTATDDFVGSPLYGYSLSNAVNGQIRAVLFDGVMTSYPFAVWGGRIKGKLAEDHQIQLGVFQLTDEMFDPENHGLDMDFEGSDGLSLFAQYDWTPKIAGRPARFFVGVNQNIGFDMDKFNSDETRDKFTRFYGHADYQVISESGDPEQGLTLFTTLAYTPYEDPAIIPVQSTIGANYKGLIPGRDDDRAVVFVTYGKFSDDYDAQQRGTSGRGADYEMVIEAGYRAQITKYAYFQPDIQYIRNPGGSGDIDDAVVLGAQFGFSF